MGGSPSWRGRSFRLLRLLGESPFPTITTLTREGGNGGEGRRMQHHHPNVLLDQVPGRGVNRDSCGRAQFMALRDGVIVASLAGLA